MGKSIWAVVAGVLFIIIITTLVDILLHAIKVYPPMTVPLTDSLAVVASSYRLVIGVLGGWVTAKLAPRNPMKHALILGLVGIMLGTAGVIATWNAGMGPRWYPVSLVILAVPQCWLGGKIFTMQAAKA